MCITAITSKEQMSATLIFKLWWHVIKKCCVFLYRVSLNIHMYIHVNGEMYRAHWICKKWIWIMFIIQYLNLIYADDNDRPWYSDKSKVYLKVYHDK